MDNEKIGWTRGFSRNAIKLSWSPNLQIWTGVAKSEDLDSSSVSKSEDLDSSSVSKSEDLDSSSVGNSLT